MAMLSEHFSKKELECPCCGEAPMEESLLACLEDARVEYGRPIYIASGFRCVKHNAEIGGGKNSAHIRGTAVDPVRPAGGRALMDMIEAFWGAGFHGFGMGKRDGTDMLHFDVDVVLGTRAWMY